MTNLLSIKRSMACKSIVLICAVMSLSACISSNTMSLPASVTQLNDLNDYDRDGVIEAREKCADTVPGARVDNDGCGTKSAINKTTEIMVKFANDSAQIPAEANSKIAQLADYMIEFPELEIIVEGHTSRVGGAEYNQTLSEQRAQSVINALANEYEIEPDRIRGIGYGFDRRLRLGNSAADHAANRRMMAKFNKTVYVDDMIWTIYTVD
jgi:outer membrane protein OmpA-like peptidoglycan-associated protein